VPHTSSEVDAYIAKAPEFARPILTRIRRAVHRASPQITETIKWGAPHFECSGLLACMAAFRKHVSFGFWKGKLLRDPEGLFAGDRSSMAGMRVESLADLPPDRVLVAYTKEAVRLNQEGVKLQRPSRSGPAKEAPVPRDLQAALRTDARALAAWQAFPPSHRKEYVHWVLEAKKAETRARRIATTLEWVREGKGRNWKYERRPR
jgi:uncharacterized protein YdeI (YjbR/CyaY-like superfamily)